MVWCAGELAQREMSRLHKEVAYLGPAIDCLKEIIAKRKELAELDTLLAECAKDSSMRGCSSLLPPSTLLSFLFALALLILFLVFMFVLLMCCVVCVFLVYCVFCFVCVYVCGIELVEDASTERTAAVNRLLSLEDECLTHLLPRNRDDHRNAVLEVRAGTGGDEASIFAADIFRMYERFCLAQGWR